MSDLIERLRGIADYADSKGSVTVARVSREAADALASRDARIVELEEAAAKHTREFLEHIRANVELANYNSDIQEQLTAANARVEALERDAEIAWACVDKLQVALDFWLPTGAGGPDPLAMRIGEDSMLLFGCPEHRVGDAESLGWITVNRAALAATAKEG